MRRAAAALAFALAACAGPPRHEASPPVPHSPAWTTPTIPAAPATPPRGVTPTALPAPSPTPTPTVIVAPQPAPAPVAAPGTVYRTYVSPAPRPAPPIYGGGCTPTNPCVGPRGGLYYLSPSGNRVYLRRR